MEEAGPTRFTIVLPAVSPLPPSPGTIFVINVQPVGPRELGSGDIVAEEEPGFGGERPVQLTGLNPNTSYRIVLQLKNATYASPKGSPLLITTMPKGMHLS